MELTEMRDRWLEAARNTHTEVSIRSMTLTARRFLAWLGDRPLSPTMCMTFRQERCASVKPISAQQDMRVLHAWFNWCVAMGYMDSNPVHGLPKLVNATRPQPVWLNDAEVKLVLDASKTANNSRYALVATAIYAGLRLRELVQFRQEDIDWEKNVLWVRHDPGNGQSTKSKKTRSVPIHPVLAELYRSLPPGPLWVLCSKTMQRLASRIRRRSGVSKFKWKVCRHTFASRLVRAGVSLKKVQTWCGHASILTTEIYAHLESGVYDEDIGRVK